MEKKSNSKNNFLLKALTVVFLFSIFSLNILAFNFFKIIKQQEDKKYKFEIYNDNFEQKHNASTKLELHDSYGTTQAFHPKVLNFEQKWNGYKYWMVFSPYPKSDDAKENPHILVSNDLVNWKEPEGFKNPLEPAPSNYKRKKIYYSDPHIVYNDDNDTIECYFRKVNDIKDEVIIYRKVTKDGINWTEKEVILKSVRSKTDYISPAIIYEEGIYKMWFVNKNNILQYAYSEDGKNYSEPQTIDIKYEIAKLKIWHLDVIKTEDAYEMIAVAYSCWENRNNMDLYYSKSDDGINWTEGVRILSPSISSWDNKGIYRSSFIKENGIYYLYYSGTDKDNYKGIGLSYGSDIYNLKGI